jgi:peptide deformylase
MVQPILQLGDPRLREVSAPVSDTDANLALWQDLEDTLKEIMGRHEFRNSAGISAVQIGILLRACLVWTPESGFLHIANPALLEGSDESCLEYEGCLSFFHKRGLVSRPTSIRVSFQTREVTTQIHAFQGWSARIILHELDHMDGILYSDRMLPQHQPISYEDYMVIRGSNAVR